MFYSLLGFITVVSYIIYYVFLFIIVFYVWRVKFNL